MKAVIFHADGRYGMRHGKGLLYKHLVEELRKNLHKFDIPLIHVTVVGHDGWSDENYFYEVDNINEVIYNRERCLLEFMRKDAKEDEIYWFCEPDFRMLKEFPPLTADLAMLYRQDPMPMTPAWRLAKKSALPVFEEAFKHFDVARKEWHGDSPAWIKMWQMLGSPTQHKTETKQYQWNDVTIELRPYGHYASRSKCIYSGQWKGGAKWSIATEEFKKWYNDYAKSNL